MSLAFSLLRDYSRLLLSSPPVSPASSTWGRSSVSIFICIHIYLFSRSLIFEVYWPFVFLLSVSFSFPGGYSWLNLGYSFVDERIIMFSILCPCYDEINFVNIFLHWWFSFWIKLYILHCIDASCKDIFKHYGKFLANQDFPQ